MKVASLCQCKPTPGFRCRGTLHDCTGRQVAPVLLLWRREMSQLWIWVHPAASDALKSLGMAAASIAGIPYDSGTKFGQVHLTHMDRLCFYELTGPCSVEVLARAVPASACRDGPGARLWGQISCAKDTRFAFPPGAVLALDVDPEVLKAQAAPKLVQHTPGRVEAPWLKQWPEARDSMLWKCGDGDTDAERVPLLLVFRPGDKGYAAGVDVLIPSSHARQLWVRCVFAEARVLGVQDRHALLTEAGIAEFPFDFPEAEAGQAQAALEAEQSEALYARKPPAKRVNFGVIGVPHPHRAMWRELRADPIFLRLPLFGPGATLKDNSFLAVKLSCPARGTPRALCHLFTFSEGDYPRASMRQRGENPPELPTDWEKLRIIEPLHTRLRRKLQPKGDERVVCKRPLIGFTTSGCYSHREARGTGVGAVAGLAFVEAARLQVAYFGCESYESGLHVLGKPWVLLWGRNTTSRVYFPVWAKPVTAETGLG